MQQNLGSGHRIIQPSARLPSTAFGIRPFQQQTDLSKSNPRQNCPEQLGQRKSGDSNRRN